MPDGPEKRFLTPLEAEAARSLAESLGLRLTKDAALPEGTGVGQKDNSVLMEAVITPDGRVCMRHIVREATDVLRSIDVESGDGLSNDLKKELA